MGALISTINAADRLVGMFRWGQLPAAVLAEKLVDLGMYDVKVEPFVFGRPVEATHNGVRWRL